MKDNSEVGDDTDTAETDSADERSTVAVREAETAEGTDTKQGTERSSPVEAGDDGVESSRGRKGRLRALARRCRRPHGRKAWIILVVVAVFVAGAVGGGYAWYRSGQLPDGVAFRVGDRHVAEEELTRYADTVRALYGVQRPESEPQRDRFRRDLAKSYALSIAVGQQAEQRGIVVTEKEAREVLSRYIREQFGEGIQARDRFVSLLGTVGTDENSVLDEIRRQLALGELFDTVTKDVHVSEADIRKAFTERREELGTPEKRSIQNIVTADRATAEAALDELRAGAPFREVAARRSIDPSTNGKGGELGEVSADQLEKSYATAAFRSSPGETFGPVRTEHGWNVGKVNGVVPGKPAVFDDVRGKLQDALSLRKAISVWQDWLRRQIDESSVVYADDYRPSDPNAIPDAIPGSATVPEHQRQGSGG